jgi:Asp-tRNA(Asn)/Glu-tRNA(Gln) amidotransferase A subunit family amidase
MAGLVPAIHDFAFGIKDVDARDERGHDGECGYAMLNTMTALNQLSATEIAQGVAAGKFTAEAVVRDCLARIEAREPAVQAWASVDPELALKQARALDRGLTRGPLHGVPIGVKDVIDTADLPTEMGSPIYRGHQPARDAACVAVVRAAGAVILGKTVTAEFAGMFPGPTTNPLDPARTPGGSSSGSAAAVADHMVPAAFGTQTGGSVLRPASYCGVVGYKPTFNLINRAGIKFAAESLDTVGLLARTIDDVELVTAALVGKSPAYRACDAAPRLGFCRTPLWETAQPETMQAVEDAASRLAAAGASVREIKLPEEFARLFHASRETINNYERSKSMAADWARDGACISKVLGDRIKLGMAMKHEDYIAALKLGEHCRAVMDGVFADYDAIIAPSVKGEAPLGLAHTGDPAFQQFWTVLYVPSITLPTHRGPNGLPVGLQVVAPRYEDDRLFACARWIFERLRPE